jgi:tetratricopeptide (TPR) repeat protein
MITHRDLSDFPVKNETRLLFALGVLVFLLYAATLSGPFIFDDRPNIQENHKIQLSRLSVKGLIAAGFESPSHRRPVANISFALNFFLHRHNVFGYHLVNILIHILNSILLYFLAKTTLNTPALRHRYDSFSMAWIPVFSAFIWGLHPLQTQSVSYIVQRMNSLAALFYILSILLYAKCRLAQNARHRGWLLAGCTASGILAIGSKEIAVTLPFFIILYEWYFLRDSSTSRPKNKILILMGALLFLIILTIAYLGPEPVNAILAAYTKRGYTAGQRVLTEFRVVIFYISLILWPHPSRLNLDHDFLISNSLFMPITTLFSAAAIVGAVGAAVVLVRKAPLISFCILWFFGNLIIESSVISLEIIFEHRTYLPSMMLILMLVSLAFKAIKPRGLCVVLLSILVIAASIGTYQRNRVWASAVTLWQDCVSKSPRKARPYNNLGVALASAGRIQDAYENYHTALRLKPDYALAHYNLGYTLARNGDLDKSLVHLNESLRIDPNHKEVHNDLGIVLIMLGRLDKATDHFRKALQIDPAYSRAHNNLGIALERQDNLAEAVYHYRAAVRLDPEYVEAHNNLGHALQRQGKFEAAQQQFSEALRINPGYEPARKNYEDNQNNLK